MGSDRLSLRSLPSVVEELRQAPPRIALVRQTPGRRIGQHTYRVILFDHRNAISGWSVHAWTADATSARIKRDPIFFRSFKGKSHASRSMTRARAKASSLRVRVAEIARADRGPGLTSCAGTRFRQFSSAQMSARRPLVALAPFARYMRAHQLRRPMTAHPRGERRNRNPTAKVVRFTSPRPAINHFRSFRCRFPQ